MRIGTFDFTWADRPMLVAEIGAAHNGSVETACKLIEIAAAAGADAVKIQAYAPDTITIDSDRPEFTIKDGPWAGRRLYDLYAQAHTPRAWFPALVAAAAAHKVMLFPSVFSIEDIEFVKQFDFPALKIASFEMTDPVLIKAAMWTGKPLVVSTGMATETEIRNASADVGNHLSVWLHCTSSYPTLPDQARMRTMDMLRRHHTYVGFSDHSLGNTLGIVAVARGASLIEKHITLTPGGPGLDDGFASGPEQFALFARAVREANAALGSRAGERGDSEHRPLRRSLYVVEAVAAGDPFTSANVRSIRPGGGMDPGWYPKVIGQRARADIPAGTPLTRDMLI